MVGDLTQIGIFGIAQPAIRQRDVEQAAEQVFKHRLIIREQPADLSRIAVEPGGAAASDVEHQPDVLLFAGRHLEYVAEGGDRVRRGGRWRATKSSKVPNGPPNDNSRAPARIRERTVLIGMRSLMGGRC